MKDLIFHRPVSFPRAAPAPLPGTAFDGEEWAVRDPQVLKGTTVTGDNYWKGKYDHENAVLMAKTYECPDPYALTEMEDLSVGSVVIDAVLSGELDMNLF